MFVMLSMVNLKLCRLCGAEFRPKDNRVGTCNACVHATDACPVCGKEKSIHKTACCRSCATKLQLSKHNQFNTEEAKAKRRATCLERYGSASSLWGSNKMATLNRNLERYGGASPFACKEVQKKSRETNLLRSGVEYGGGSVLAQQKKDATMLERYGVASNKHMHLRNVSDLTKEFIESKLLDERGRLMVRSIIDYFGYSGWGHVYRACTRLGVKYIRNFRTQQDELASFIRSLYTGAVITDTRTLIRPREIDIYLPDLKLAFEYNGTYWHSDKVILENKGMSAEVFHKLKFDMCDAIGVRLFFVREEDWVGNREYEEQRISKIVCGLNEK